MGKQTSVAQRQAFYAGHQRGETYVALAQGYQVSKECVRYWCRRQAAGRDAQTRYPRRGGGLLQRFHPLVRYRVLRLKVEHPRWGPNRIRARLKKTPTVQYLRLPSESQLGRYLHQWPRFHRQPKVVTAHPRPEQPTAVHQRWQIDFKLGIRLHDGLLVNLHTVRDPVGEACLGAVLFPAGQAPGRARRVTVDQVRAVLRRCFAHWNTLPDEVQTDGESTLAPQAGEAFPPTLTLWLVGLGIQHRVIRAGKPTDQAEVERCHRTVTDYAVVGQEANSVDRLQGLLDQAVWELTFELPSRAEGCHGLPPASAHPELLQPRHPFAPEQELQHFDRRRVDRYLATFTWHRQVGKTGQICLGGWHEYYFVSRAYAQRLVTIRFDPLDRNFVFYERDDATVPIGRRLARGLELEDLTGLAVWPLGMGPQQLPLPLPMAKGLNC